MNGLLQSGYSKYEANIAADALSDENIRKMKNNGSEVTVQGRTMYKVNEGNRVVYDSSLGAFKYVAQVYYDPQTRGLLVEDIESRGGKIYLTGRISSTGNGKILATDSGAQISITNATSADLTTGKIINNNLAGTISITDLAKNTWTEYSRTATNSMSLAAYEKYLKLTDGQKARGKANRRLISGLRYNWTVGQESGTTKYYQKTTSTLFWGGLDIDTSENKLAEEEKRTTPTEKTEPGRKLGSGTFVDAITSDISQYGTEISNTPFGAILESQKTSESRTVTGEWKESGNWWALWSNPKYHTTWTTKSASTQSYTFSLKADNPIAIGFLGQEHGAINLSNTNANGGNINLNGNIRNNTSLATLDIKAAGGSIVQKSGTFLTTGVANLQAKNHIENIHIASMGERVATGKKDADGNDSYITRDGVMLSALSSHAGNIDVEVVGGTAEGQALPGNVVLSRLASEGKDTDGKPGNVSLKAEGNITQTTDAVTVKGREIRLTSVKGSIGTFEEVLNQDGSIARLVPKQAIVVDSVAEAYGSGEDTASVNAEAQKHIYLAEKDGDMRVGSIISKEGDVRLEATDGRFIDALPQTGNGNNMDEDDLVRHWIDSGLIAGTEDYEGAYIRGLKQDAANYKARVEAQYQEFKNGPRERSLRQQFTKPGSTETYASVSEYLAQDKTYQALPESSRKAYADAITDQFNQFMADDAIQKKFTRADGTRYISAREYLRISSSIAF